MRLFLGTEEAGWECNTSFCKLDVSHDSPNHQRLTELTQLTFGSKKRHHTPSSRISFMRRQRFRNTASMRFRSSMIAVSSFALVGFAA